MRYLPHFVLSLILVLLGSLTVSAAEWRIPSPETASHPGIDTSPHSGNRVLPSVGYHVRPGRLKSSDGPV